MRRRIHDFLLRLLRDRCKPGCRYWYEDIRRSAEEDRARLTPEQFVAVEDAVRLLFSSYENRQARKETK